jgi:hypothetical protein
MSFQSQVYNYLPKGNVGSKASLNPLYTVKAGQGNLTAGSQGAVIGKFGWMSYAVSTEAAVVNNFSSLPPVAPTGFIANEMQALNVTFLQQSGLTIPAGYGVTLFDRGDFFVVNPYNETVIGNKVFANLFTGDIFAGVAGSFNTNSFGSASAITGTISAGSFSLNITAVASGVPAIGQQVFGTNIPLNTFIDQIGTFNGSTGTVILTQAPLYSITAGSLTTTTPTGIGGGVGTASFATNVMTVTATTSGTFAVGQIISSASVAAGTYITSLGTYNGSTGTLNLSTTPGTIAAQAVTSTAFIETPFYFTSAGNVGDLVTISLH